MTIFSPKSVGRHGHAEVDFLGRPFDGEADLDAAVLGQALLGDVELRHDLDARRDRVAELHRRRHHVVEDAVDAEANPELLLVRLDVDVARALLNRRHQHQVDEPDDRRLAALPLERGDIDLLELLEQLDIVVNDLRGFLERLGDHLEGRGAREVGLLRVRFGLLRLLLRRSRAHGHLRRGRRRRVVPLDRVCDSRLGRDDRLHVVARHELDVVHGEDVRGIGNRNRQGRAGPAQRDDLIFLGGVGRDQLDHRLIDFKLGQVDRGHAVLLAEQRRDFFVGHETELDEIQAQLPAVGLLIVERLLQLRRSDALFLQKQVADADGHRYNSDRQKLAAQITTVGPDHVSRRGRTRWGR